MKGGGSNQKSIVRLIGAITIIRSIPDSENNLDIGCCTQYYLKRRGRPIRNLRVDGSQCSGRIHNVESDNSSRKEADIDWFGKSGKCSAEDPPAAKKIQLYSRAAEKAGIYIFLTS